MVQSDRRAIQIAKEVNAGSGRKNVSEYTVHCNLLHMGLHSQGAHADPCPPLKAPTMGMGASELDHGAMEEGSLV